MGRLFGMTIRGLPTSILDYTILRKNVAQAQMNEREFGADVFPQGYQYSSIRLGQLLYGAGANHFA
jgi:hypothetical protein